jgi:hypothetical protein
MEPLAAYALELGLAGALLLWALFGLFAIGFALVRSVAALVRRMIGGIASGPFAAKDASLPRRKKADRTLQMDGQ